MCILCLNEIPLWPRCHSHMHIVESENGAAIQSRLTLKTAAHRIHR